MDGGPTPGTLSRQPRAQLQEGQRPPLLEGRRGAASMGAAADQQWVLKIPD